MASFLSTIVIPIFVAVVCFKLFSLKIMKLTLVHFFCQKKCFPLCCQLYLSSLGGHMYSTTARQSKYTHHQYLTISPTTLYMFPESSPLIFSLDLWKSHGI